MVITRRCTIYNNVYNYAIKTLPLNTLRPLLDLLNGGIISGVVNLDIFASLDKEKNFQSGWTGYGLTQQTKELILEDELRRRNSVGL